MRYQVGDRVITRKPHPCGGREWEIVRVGSDIKIKCLSCGRIVMLPRQDFERAAKKRLGKDATI